MEDGKDDLSRLLRILNKAGALPEVGLKSLYKTATPGTNFAETPNTFLGDSTYKVNQTPNRWNVEGVVYKNNPNLAYILNPTPGTIAHEGQHTQQYKAPNWDGRVLEADSKMRYPVADLANSLKEDKLASRLLNANSFNNLKEVFSTLAEIEANQPAGKTLKDHPIVGKYISPKIRKLTDTYLYPQFDKVMEPTDFVPNDSGKSYIEEFQNWVRNKTSR